jgi:hypothetical protein
MTVVAMTACFARSTRWRLVALLLVAGVASALPGLRFPSIMGIPMPPMDAGRLLLGLVGFIAALEFASQPCRVRWPPPSIVILLASIGCVMVGWLGGVSWPNSGDEYSYLFLADTFRAGRLWDPPPPDPELFQAFHVLVKDGRTFSPYPPAWSAFLMPLRAFNVAWLENPLLTAVLGALLAAVYRRLGVCASMRASALAVVLLTPFALFLGGSLFPQTMAAALVTAIVWAQLADEAQPRAWRKLSIGALFGVLLLTRYEVFAITALLYAVDRLVRRRFAGIVDGLIVTIGLLPFVLGLLAYDAAITGNPWQLTSTWASSLAASAATYSPLVRNLYWLGGLAEFGGLPVLLMAAIALVAKLRQHNCRFYDLLLPAALLFYSFVQFTGGHQYGPRYWFWVWPLGTLTIITGLVDPRGEVRVFGKRVPFTRLASALLLYAIASFGTLLVTTHGYMAERRTVLDFPAPSARTVVLIPKRELRRWWWPGIPAPAMDFTRNDIDYSDKVLFGRGDLADAVERACRLKGREVLRWEQPGRYVPVVCP